MTLVLFRYGPICSAFDDFVFSFVCFMLFVCFESLFVGSSVWICVLIFLQKVK
eukprot:m.73866 g.73866  ORF g.73866 m.73866 type:complete len:53 (+) comp20378_c1_seq1:1811-1969(+)